MNDKPENVFCRKLHETITRLALTDSISEDEKIALLRRALQIVENENSRERKSNHE